MFEGPKTTRRKEKLLLNPQTKELRELKAEKDPKFQPRNRKPTFFSPKQQTIGGF